ncbi:hypothetical protein GGR57DRAFT_255509 [Xylariaceae sp. FL1272]|nr:hypothetical protein GGR57DRAFT_255509 [Xylariaceae sp. FL1272]
MAPNRVASPGPRALGAQALITLGLFQAIIAFPVVLFLGGCAFYWLYDDYYSRYYGRFYYFFSDFINALLGAGIIFIVLVQRKTRLDRVRTLLFESTKSILATAMWLWLLFDTLFGPWQNGLRDDTRERAKANRLARTGTAILILLLFFYPSVAYAYCQWKTREEGGADEGEAEPEQQEEPEPDEQSPLLV